MRPALALLAVIVGLAALLVAELTSTALPEPELPARAASSPGPPAPAPVAAVRPDEVAAIVLERPLLAPSRRAAATPIPRSAAQATMPRLAGVIVSPVGSRAIFAPAEGKPLVLAVGDLVGHYTIKSILPDQVILVGSEGEQIIRPTHESAPPPPAVPPRQPVAAGRPRGGSVR